MPMLVGLILAASPIVITVLLLALSGWLQRRRAAEIAHQVRITDAIHSHLGAALAPFVRKPFGRPWRVSVRTPLERPELVDALFGIVADEFAAAHRGQPAAFELVLTPRDKTVAPVHRSAAAAPRHAALGWH